MKRCCQDVLASMQYVVGASDNAGIGQGPNFSVPFDVTVDPASNRAFVPDYGIDQLLSINLTNGDRTNIHPFTTVQQLNLLNPYYMQLDIANDRAFMWCGASPA